MVLDGRSGNPSQTGPYRKPAGGMGANQGAVYAVCGCSGVGGIGEFALHPAMFTNRGGYRSMILEVEDLRLTGRFLDRSGEVEDLFVVDKSAPSSVAPRLEFLHRTNGLAITWPTARPEFALEQTTTLDSVRWQSSALIPELVGRRLQVLLPTNTPALFFQLRAGNSVTAPCRIKTLRLAFCTTVLPRSANSHQAAAPDLIGVGW